MREYLKRDQHTLHVTWGENPSARRPARTVICWRLSLEKDMARIKIEVCNALEQRSFSNIQRGYDVLVVV